MTGHKFEIFNEEGVRLSSRRYFKKYSKAVRDVKYYAKNSSKAFEVIYVGRQGDGTWVDQEKLDNLPEAQKSGTIIFTKKEAQKGA